jgi:ribose 5-phosphate isomerase B
MRIAIASDHGGVDAKQALITFLEENGHEPLDLGTNNTDSCDYPDYAAAVAQALQGNKADRGVLVCGTGIGMAMTANRFSDVRAAVVADTFSAAMCREHNNANVICFGARLLAIPAMERFLQVFLETDFAGGRHDRRVAKINSFDQVTVVNNPV